MHAFDLYLPTRLVFGKDRLNTLDTLTRGYGDRVLLVAGTGSARRSGLIDRVKAALPGREIFELEGVVPNPRIDSVRAGARLCKQKNIDFIVAVGGGSVIDCSKAIAAGAASDLEPWDLVVNPGKIEKALPFFTVLTLSATGSEYDNSALNNSPLNREGFDKIRTLQTSVLPPVCRHPDHETLSDAALGRSGVSFPAAGIA